MTLILPTIMISLCIAPRVLAPFQKHTFLKHTAQITAKL